MILLLAFVAAAVGARTQGAAPAGVGALSLRIQPEECADDQDRPLSAAKSRL